ncbi:MAG: copper amine oxidase [Actinomycetia bacterium]|nr:copper amine oxidase [Actinomycetes bacterium]
MHRVHPVESSSRGAAVSGHGIVNQCGRGRTRRAGVTIMSAAVAMAGLTGCGSSSAPSASPVTVFSVSADPGSDLPVVDAKHPVVLTAVKLRSTLDSLLSEHASLVATVMHLVGAGDDNPSAAVSALGANTKALTDAIAVIYGVDGARAFAQLWQQHTQFFVDIAHADRTHDAGAKDLAQRQLLDYQNDFASFVTTATAGGASLVAVTGLLHGHVADFMSYIEADVGGNRREALRLRELAVAHMHVIAKAIADAIVAQHLKTVR